MRSISVLYYRIRQGIETLLIQTTMSSTGSISAIVPARNEEAVIAACIESLAAQPEISEIIAVTPVRRRKLWRSAANTRQRWCHFHRNKF